MQCCKSRNCNLQCFCFWLLLVKRNEAKRSRTSIAEIISLISAPRFLFTILDIFLCCFLVLGWWHELIINSWVSASTMVSLCILSMLFWIRIFCSHSAIPSRSIYFFLDISQCCVEDFLYWYDSQRIHVMIDLVATVNQCYLHYFHLCDDFIIWN